jgi:hypothetical protein
VLGRRRRAPVAAGRPRKRPGVARRADLDSGRIGRDLGASTTHALSVVRRRGSTSRASPGRIRCRPMSPEEPNAQRLMLGSQTSTASGRTTSSRFAHRSARTTSRNADRRSRLHPSQGQTWVSPMGKSSGDAGPGSLTESHLVLSVLRTNGTGQERDAKRGSSFSQGRDVAPARARSRSRLAPLRRPTRACSTAASGPHGAGRRV